MTLFTVGHGTRSVDELAEVVRAAGVELVVDVRRHPGSRRHPHLAGPALAESLPERGVAYRWEGEVLGGRRSGVPGSRHPAWENASFRAYADHLDTDEPRAALRVLLAETEHRPLAVMCAETVWWRCHRRLLADAAVLAGTPVVHLLGERTQPHPLHPAVRAGDDGWPVYDVGVQPPLLTDTDTDTGADPPVTGS